MKTDRLTIVRWCSAMLLISWPSKVTHTLRGHRIIRAVCAPLKQKTLLQATTHMELEWQGTSVNRERKVQGDKVKLIACWDRLPHKRTWWFITKALGDTLQEYQEDIAALRWASKLFQIEHHAKRTSQWIILIWVHNNILSPTKTHMQGTTCTRSLSQTLNWWEPALINQRTLKFE
jgi:hypothetical protein